MSRILTQVGCAAALVLGGLEAVPAQTAAPGDQAVPARSTGAWSLRTLIESKPRINPLPRPDTSRAFAEPDDGRHDSGVMTDQGAEFVPDFSVRAYGAFGIPYTTTRVQDGLGPAAGWQNTNRLSTTYPYRTVGKLTFRIGADSYHCSASVIRRGVIVTAAHCIQDFGSGSDLFTDHVFTPATYAAGNATATQIAPYGSWKALRLVRPVTWARGTDTGCDSARNNDLAVIALKKDSNGKFIGQRVGKMSYGWNNYGFVASDRTGNLKTGAVSTLGYPGDIDAGRIMQRTDGPTYVTAVCKSQQLWQGSNFTGGSSGGPWVVNFATRSPQLSGGAVVGTASRLAVIGVTSWGSEDPNAPKDNYSSQFAQNKEYPNANYGGYGGGNIGSLLNTLCNSQAPEGGTLAERGYCD